MGSFDEFFKEERICVIVPTYNNAATLAGVLDRVLLQTSNLIVVNDGSTDDTWRILEEEAYSCVEKVSYQRNRGKGYALKSGFKRAIELGYSYALTLDSDGQHFPEDIQAFADKFRTAKGALLAGVRSFDNENMPGKNQFANNFSNFWFRLQTGVRLPDTQCGFRMYPLERLKLWWPITYRYEAELEYLVFLSWSGVSVVPVPVNVFYPPENERISHFKPAYDFFRISVLNTLLTLLSVFTVPARLFRRLRSR